MRLDTLYEHTLALQPDKVALIIDDVDVEVTFQQLDLTADRYARIMVGLGVEPGDRVALFMGNRKELAALYLACFRLGAVAVPTSCYSKPPEVAYEMNHCRARLLLAEPELLPGVMNMTEQAPSLDAVYMVGGEPDDPRSSWDKAASNAAPVSPIREPLPQDSSVILYTSGSTGRPKGVTHTVFSLYNSTLNRCAALRHNPDDIFLITSYLCHGSALTSVFLTMLSVGGTSVLMRHWTAQGFLDCLRRRRPTVAACAPSQLQAVLDRPDCTMDDFSSVRYLHVGGDAVPEPLFDAFHDKTGLELSVAMGMTECGGYMLSPLEGPVRRGSMGKPISGTEIRLVDEHGADSQKGEPGQIIVRTKALMSGYWNDPQHTNEAIRDGWLYTGDLAVADDEGFYYFVGRSKHIIVRDTGNVAPAEVESAMESHPKVKACGVTGIPDGMHGEAVLAFIVPTSTDEPPNEKELASFAQDNLAVRKVPQRWVIVDDIPLTPMAKIDRKALKQMSEKILAIDERPRSTTEING